VIPKPPFAAELSLEAELAAFEALKPRLKTLWSALSATAEEPYTSVVVPSMTLDPHELSKLEAASYYEERLLFLLIRLRNPQARMVYVTSQPVHPLILESYFQLLAGIPASHARSRLSLLCAYDASPRPLTQKILERPRLIQRIRYGIADASRAYLTVFNSTPLERKLAVLLGIPLNGVDPSVAHLGTKSGSRRIFREAGVDFPDGFENLRSEAELLEGLDALRRRNPALRRAMLKFDDSFSGEGNALFEYSDASGRLDVSDLRRIVPAVAEETPDSYLAKFTAKSGVVEEFLEPPCVAPSAQLRIDPQGEVVLLSTHDQILGGRSGQVYQGCRFPAANGYRRVIQEAARRIGAVLARRGVVSRFGIDFLVRPGPERPGGCDVKALEINLRMGGTTHPFLALQFLTGGHLDPESGDFLSPRGLPKYYRSTDNLKSPAYRGICPEDLIDMTTANHLHFNHATESGVLFHMIGALSQFGKVGLTAIGNSREESDEFYERALAVLDREAGR
jgi:hypothetical protein